MMIELTVIRDLVAIASFILALGYYILNLRNQKETRQAQLFMQLYEQYRSKEMWKDGWELLQYKWEDFEDFANKYDSSVNMDSFLQRYSYWTYFDGMGILLKKGLIDKEMLFYLQGGYTSVWIWDLFKDIIYESRKRMNAPEHFMMFEYLVDELKEMKIQRGHTIDAPSTLGNFVEDIKLNPS